MLLFPLGRFSLLLVVISSSLMADLISGNNDSCFRAYYLYTTNICYCMTSPQQILLKFLWKAQKKFWIVGTFIQEKELVQCVNSALAELNPMNTVSATPIAKVSKGMAEAARSPHPTGQAKLFLSLRQNPAAGHSPLYTDSHSDGTVRYTACQILADGSSSRKFKTLELKSRFLEQLLSSDLLFFCLKTRYVLCCMNTSHLLLCSSPYHLPSSVQISSLQKLFPPILSHYL